MERHSDSRCPLKLTKKALNKDNKVCEVRVKKSSNGTNIRSCYVRFTWKRCQQVRRVSVCHNFLLQTNWFLTPIPLLPRSFGADRRVLAFPERHSPTLS